MLNIKRNFLLGFFVIVFLIGCGSGGSTTPTVTPEPTTFSVTINITGSGSVKANQDRYSNGTIATFNVIPDEGYILTSLSGCGVDLDYDNEFSANSFTTYSDAIVADCELVATFSQRVKLLDIFASDALRECAISNSFTENEPQKVFADEVIYLDCRDKLVTDTSGIDHLVKLELLLIDRTGITELTLNNNHRLKTLYASENQLTELDLSSNPFLDSLSVAFNNIEFLDISKNNSLRILDVYANELVNMDLSQNSMLTNINLGANKAIKTIDLSQNPDLTDIDLSAMLLTELDLSQNPLLEYVNAEFNQLSSIDLSNNLAINSLNIGGNVAMSDLDVSMLSQLKYLSISANKTAPGKISQLDLSQNSNLHRLWSDNQSLKQLDLSQNSELRELSVNFNHLESIDLSYVPKLYSLDLRNNLLTNLDLSLNTQLEQVYYDPQVICTGSKCL